MAANPIQTPRSHNRAVTVDVHDAIAPLAADWEALAERAGAPPFARPGWFGAWWPAFGAGEPVVVATRRGGRLTGVLPLSRRAGVLASPTNAHTPAFPLLAEDASAAAELAAWLFDQRPRRVQLDYVDAADPAVPELYLAAARSGHRVLRTTVQRSPYAVLARRRGRRPPPRRQGRRQPAPQPAAAPRDRSRRGPGRDGAAAARRAAPRGLPASSRPAGRPSAAPRSCRARPLGASTSRSRTGRATPACCGSRSCGSTAARSRSRSGCRTARRSTCSRAATTPRSAATRRASSCSAA